GQGGHGTRASCQRRKAAAVRESSIKQAGYQAEVDQAQSRALQAGPLAEALARQEVVRAETAAAELDAARREKVLESEVHKPADAEAYRQVTLADAAQQTEILRAQAQAQQTTLRGEAEARATEVNGRALAMSIEARGRAEAVGIQARAAALASNPDAVIAQQIAEHYPAIVTAGASALSNIDNLVVLNGAEGMEDLLGKALTMGGAGLGLARTLMSSIQGPGGDPRASTAAVPVSTNGKPASSALEAEESPARDSSA
ncbi:MAG: flotillin family protein, partial [Actinomycetota bacterium]|nr:flotillin family protein [Actinomycetota bacterium]